MNKTELIAAIAAKAELSKKDAEAAVSATFDAIKDALNAVNEYVEFFVLNSPFSQSILSIVLV